MKPHQLLAPELPVASNIIANATRCAAVGVVDAITADQSGWKLTLLYDKVFPLDQTVMLEKLTPCSSSLACIGVIMPSLATWAAFLV